MWPVENAVIALGMKRYGFDAEAERLVSALVDAAGCYLGVRLPEAFSGRNRCESAVPVPYLRLLKRVKFASRWVWRAGSHLAPRGSTCF